MADVKAPTGRCRCGHTRLWNRRLHVVVCPACDLVGSWPRWAKGAWVPV